MTHDPDIFYMKSSPVKVILLFTLSLAFIALIIWLLITTPNPSTKLLVISWAGIPLFGLCGIMWLKQLFHSDPSLRIDHNGIWFKRWSDQTILWQDIKEVSVFSVQKQKMIGLLLNDRGKYPGRGILGLLAGANKMLSSADISIPVTGGDKSFAEIMDAISHYSGKF